MERSEKVKSIEKLHRQLRHQPASVTEDILKRADCATAEIKQINEDIVKNCETCIKFKRNKPRPIVAPPMASKFNEVIAMDLKVLYKRHLYIIYFINMFTQFAKRCNITLKTSKPCCRKFYYNVVGVRIWSSKKGNS